ncbi:hypothetical protein Ddc_01017 [Ditylenchus destructor]|nr:hypothetical protein Ddc_01017 [Ditylenchus destructor]
MSLVVPDDCFRPYLGNGAAYGGFVSANSRPTAARTVALSVPTRGLRPLERWLCQCQLAAFGRSNGGFVSANSRPTAARTVALSVPTQNPLAVIKIRSRNCRITELLYKGFYVNRYRLSQ